MTVTKMGALLLIIYLDHETGVSDICFFRDFSKKTNCKQTTNTKNPSQQWRQAQKVRV